MTGYGIILRQMKELSEKNCDLCLREFSLPPAEIPCALIFFEGVADKNALQASVLDPILQPKEYPVEHAPQDAERALEDRFLCIRIRLEGVVCEHTDRNRRLDSPEVLSEIEDAVSAQIEQRIDRMLQTVCSEWRCDCIDVTRYAKKLFREDPPADIRDLISTAAVRASVETKLRFSGEVM